MNSINLSLPIFIICTILFFLPFIRVDCGGMETKKITGIQIAFGFEDKTVNEIFKTKEERNKLEIFGLLAYLVTVGGIVFNLLGVKNKKLLSGILSFLLIVFLFLLKTNLDNLAEKEKISMFLKYEWPFWTIIILSILNIMNSIIPLKISDKQQSTTNIETKEGE